MVCKTFSEMETQLLKYNITVLIMVLDGQVGQAASSSLSVQVYSTSFCSCTNLTWIIMFT